jgi:hypothetical protein
MLHSQEATRALQEVERLRRRVHADLHHVDVALIVFGSLMLASALASGSTTSLGRYWAVAAPAGTLLTVWHYRRQGRERGIAGSTWIDLGACVAIVIAAFAAATVAARIGSPLAAAVAPVAAVALAYLLLAWFTRTLILALIASGLALLALALWLQGVAPERAATVLAEAGGASLLAAGIGYWFAGRRT